MFIFTEDTPCHVCEGAGFAVCTGRSEVNLGCWSAPSKLFETSSLCWCVPQASPAPISHLPVGTLGYGHCATCLAFVWALGIRPQVLLLASASPTELSSQIKCCLLTWFLAKRPHIYCVFPFKVETLAVHCKIIRCLMFALSGCLCLCECMPHVSHVSRYLCGGCCLPELEPHAAVNWPMWVLGTKFMSSEKAISTPNCLTISLVSKFKILRDKFQNI